MFSQTQTAVRPAHVIAIDGERLLLQMPEHQCWASLALAYPYAPQVGDVLLAIGDDDDVYVIGVIQGRGKTRFEAPGDLEIAARGKLDLHGELGVTLRGPSIEVQADKLELVARQAFERFVDVYRFAKGVVQNSAARVRTLVSGTYTVQAEQVVVQADKDVKIDGEHINLG